MDDINTNEFSSMEIPPFYTVDNIDDKEYINPNNNKYEGYELYYKLGQGHFGSVWKALRLSDGEIIALKIILLDPRNPKALQDVEREVSVLKKISDPKCNPYMACLYDYKYLPDTNEFLIEMELIKGNTLKEYITRVQDSVKYKHLIAITKDITNTLSVLHNNGIIHNDVKPDNIIINNDMAPILVDFGVACENLSICLMDKKDKTKSGLCCKNIIGPNMYISPETIKTGGYFLESDIWSLGVTLYLMATGSYPFKTKGSSVSDLVQSIIKQDIIILNTSNKKLNYIVNHALIKDPNKRITLGEIKDILK